MADKNVGKNAFERHEIAVQEAKQQITVNNVFLHGQRPIVKDLLYYMGMVFITVAVSIYILLTYIPTIHMNTIEMYYNNKRRM